MLPKGCQGNAEFYPGIIGIVFGSKTTDQPIVIYRKGAVATKPNLSPSENIIIELVIEMYL